MFECDGLPIGSFLNFVIHVETLLTGNYTLYVAGQRNRTFLHLRCCD